MPKAWSQGFKRAANAVATAELPLVLIEITHPALSVPVRFVNDVQDLVSNGDTYTACGFRCVLPDDRKDQLPRARLEVDNVGEELTAWIDGSAGGEGATIRFQQVLRSAPDDVEYEVTMDLQNVTVTWSVVSAELGFENLLDRPLVAVSFRPDTAPGLF